LLTDHPDQAEQLRAYGLLAVVCLRQGNPTAARQAAEQAAHRIAKFRVPTAHYLLEGYAGVAEVSLSLWETKDSSDTSRAARRACRDLRSFARIFPIGKPRARLWQGHLAQLSGRTESAQAAWRAGFASAERLGMPFEAALAGRAEIGDRLGEVVPVRRVGHRDLSRATRYVVVLRPRCTSARI
jgi:eukaryotic-like serine/threonine-protein kinase